jgi:hypothetical protein
VSEELRPLIARLPAGYRIEEAGSIEEAGKATKALLPLFPIMLALTLLIIIIQVRSMSAMAMVFATAPLGLIGVVPTLLIFGQPFGINALVGLIALSGILMRNTLILLGQIQHNLEEGLTPFDAVVESTVQRARPVILTALAAISRLHPADTLRLLGNPGLHVDRRHVRRDSTHARLPALDVCHLVPDRGEVRGRRRFPLCPTCQSSAKPGPDQVAVSACSAAPRG